MPQNALVTGASAGLGREFVRQLVLDRGMSVLATARRRERLEELAAELPSGRVLVEAGDLADADFRRHLWLRGEAMPGGLDLLINNAGLGNYAEFADQDFDAVKRILDVNLIALMDLTQRAVRHMRARGSGQVLQVSSVLGSFGNPYAAAYVASKHAVNGLVKSLRYELRGSGVRVRAACPGRTVSEFARVALADPKANGPLPRGESTEAVVRAIVRRLDGHDAFILPTWQARASVWASQWFPGPFDAFMNRWAPGFFSREIERARRGGPS